MAQPKSFGLVNQISKDSENFQPESGRYHLYLAHSCPFCLRTHLALRLKGLQDHISISAAHPVTQKTKPDVDDHVGFVFRNETDEPVKTVAGLGSFPCKGCIPDTLNNCKTARELYEISGNAPTTYSLPVLWDKKNKTIVNNESGPIVRIFSSAFNDIAKNPGLDLYPEALRDKINETNDFVDKEVNARIFKCGRAQNQQEYEENVNALFAALDKSEDILSKNRYLCGSQLTESDIRLFALLVRFDETFYINFKCNKKRILDYPNLLNYCREIYQLPGVAETINMDHIKMSVYNMIPVLNPYAIIPAGPNFVATLQEKHNRDSL